MVTLQPEEKLLGRLAKTFLTRFGAWPRLFRAPGRVNLIGEHTDYNDGFVLPAAIDLYTWTAIAGRKDSRLRVHSENLKETSEIDLADPDRRARKHWSDYVQGVALMLQEAGVSLRGADIAIYSNIPSGAGLSSSAALEVSVASALLGIAGHSLEKMEIAKLCQRAEKEFVGAKVGIMDQFAACFGSAGHALLLDCRSLKFQQLLLPANVALIICNTMVRHEHAGGEYNRRRAQCEEGVRTLQHYFPSAKALRDVTLENLQAHRGDVPEIIYERCHHVISENDRVLRFADALAAGDLAMIGCCMAESHLSMKNDFQITCEEVDEMVDIARRQNGAIGSRMTGGGFGGCTVNLVNTEAAKDFKRTVSEEYRRFTQIDVEIYEVKAGAGVTEVAVHGLDE